jgi:hypothetical protein
VNIELKDKICSMSEELSTRISYELNYICDNDTGMFMEVHRFAPNGYESIHMPSISGIMSLKIEDFIKKREN